MVQIQAVALYIIPALLQEEATGDLRLRCLSLHNDISSLDPPVRFEALAKAVGESASKSK